VLDFVLIAIPTGIVARLAKNKGYSPVSFGTLTAIAAFLCALVGAYFLGFVGDLIGIVIGGVIMEEIIKNMREKPIVKKQVFCPQCGLKQD
jgi:NADH:ubiquinone oxidoreductase subunit 6 (subunit J)